MTIAIVLFVLSISKKTDFIRQPLDSFTNKLFIFNSGTDQIASHINGNFIDVQALNDEHEDLRKKVIELEQQLSSYAAIANENEQLKSLLSITNDAVAKSLVVRVINTEQGIKNNIIFINAGENGKLFVGQNIFDSHGLVGQIISTSGDSSRVLLITDVNSYVPVYNGNNNEEYVVKGSNSNELDVVYLRSKSKVAVGDVLYTNDLGGRFLPNYPVAVVTKVQRDLDQSIIQVKAEPLANLNSFKFIVAVWPYCQNVASTTSDFGANYVDATTVQAIQEEPSTKRQPSADDLIFDQLVKQDYRIANCFVRNTRLPNAVTPNDKSTKTIESKGGTGE